MNLEGDWLFIDGERSASSGRGELEVICPSTEEVVGRAPDASSDDIEQAVNAAARAEDVGSWARTPMTERIDVVDDAATRLESKVEAVGHLMTLEMGVPISMSRRVARGCIDRIRFFCELARSTSLAELRTDGIPASVEKEPGGVVAAIAPWNGPFSMAVTKIVPPLLAGCSVVFKPAPETPFDVAFLVEALHEAGLPTGAVNVVTGGAAVGERLVAHPLVDRVSFTGSTSAGREIGAICGRHLKPAHLELGGKSAGIVLEDADIDVVKSGLGAGCFSNSGQICVALSRVLVPRSREEEMIQLLCDATASWRPGDPFDENTTMGPLVSSRQRTRVERYIEVGRTAGARVATGGGRPPHLSRGWFVEPTVLTAVDNSMTVAREEIFGPVAVVIPYDDVDDAVAIANDSDYGLHGAVFTADPAQGLDVARRVRTGTFTINGFVYNTHAPFGGVKASGIGRDTGREGFESYFDLKTINLAPGMGAWYTGRSA